jgi:hypothetical protein
MSGGIVQLVATGAQDTWLSGKPEISFFRSNYKRYTHYAAAPERQTIQGIPFPGSISTIRIEKKGDLLSYMYLTARDPNGAQIPNLDWTQVIDRIELLIGGQVIDLHDVNYDLDVEPVVGGSNWSQRYLNSTGTIDNYKPSNKKSSFYPLKFFFCKDWSVSLPLVALQYHDVEIRITWAPNLNNVLSPPLQSPNATTTYAALNYQCWCNFVYLDQAEREYFAQASHDLLITQVQRVPIGTNAVQELALAQPVKFLAFQCLPYGPLYSSTALSGTFGSGSPTAANYQLKVQINGVDVGESRPLPCWTNANQYYHTPWGYDANGGETPILIIPYCLDTSKLQPTGTLNFSRLDTYRIVVPNGLANGLQTLVNYQTFDLTTTGSGYPGVAPISATQKGTAYLYAVNYNVLRLQKGMGSVLYAN